MLETEVFENSINYLTLKYKNNKINKYFQLYSDRKHKRNRWMFTLTCLILLIIIGLMTYSDLNYAYHNDVYFHPILYIWQTPPILGMILELVLSRFRQLRSITTISVCIGMIIGCSLRTFCKEIYKESYAKYFYITLVILNISLSYWSIILSVVKIGIFPALYL